MSGMTRIATCGKVSIESMISHLVLCGRDSRQRRSLVANPSITVSPSSTDETTVYRVGLSSGTGGIFSFIQSHDFGDFVPLGRDDESVNHTRILLNWLKTKQNKAMKRRQYALLR
jgi:hypothetical protein